MWDWIKALGVFIGLGAVVVFLIARYRLRRVDRIGDRIQGDIGDISSRVDDIQAGTTKAQADSERIADIGREAAGILESLTGSGERSETALERLEQANKRFAELIKKANSKD